MVWPTTFRKVAIVAALAAFFESTLPSLAAVSSGPVSLDDGYRDMYNLAFAQAHTTFQTWEGKHPEDPLGTVSDAAAYMFAEFDRLRILRSEFFTDDDTFLHHKALHPDPETKRRFEAALEQSRQQSEAVLKQKPEDQSAMLATVLRLALHANYLALIDKQYWESLNEIKEARNDADQLLTKYPDCYDADLALGVENYLLSQKIAPVRLFLRMTGAQTDKQVGLAKLRLVAQKGRYLKPYAKILLAIAALRNGNRQEARQLIEELAAQFPQNDLFQRELKKLS